MEHLHTPVDAAVGDRAADAPIRTPKTSSGSILSIVVMETDSKRTSSSLIHLHKPEHYIDPLYYNPSTPTDSSTASPLAILSPSVSISLTRAASSPGGSAAGSVAASPGRSTSRSAAGALGTHQHKVIGGDILGDLVSPRRPSQPCALSALCHSATLAPVACARSLKISCPGRCQCCCGIASEGKAVDDRLTDGSSPAKSLIVLSPSLTMQQQPEGVPGGVKGDHHGVVAAGQLSPGPVWHGVQLQSQTHAALQQLSVKHRRRGSESQLQELPGAADRGKHHATQRLSCSHIDALQQA